ncbi:MAG: amidinotransferase [Prevotella sp.]|nr:amidinotransferase [Prevotella sp.]
MVRPVRFAFNEETAANNAFQQRSETEEAAQATAREAIEEFDAFVRLLCENGITVEVVQDTPEPFTPDSIFPNNCFSVHGDTLVLYPMFAPNRRLELKKLINFRFTDFRFSISNHSKLKDLTHYEESGRFLEGTGSLVLDREHRVAYACLSPRTDEEVLKEWASAMGYSYLTFHSQDGQGMPVYHTNVMMHVGSRQAVVCLESIPNPSEREALKAMLEQYGKEVVPITLAQMNQFAGNMLELHNDRGEQLLVMSQTARRSLTTTQIATLSKHTRILSPDIHAIEAAGGGSARCMMAEIF